MVWVSSCPSPLRLVSCSSFIAKILAVLSSPVDPRRHIRAEKYGVPESGVHCKGFLGFHTSQDQIDARSLYHLRLYRCFRDGHSRYLHDPQDLQQHFPGGICMTQLLRTWDLCDTVLARHLQMGSRRLTTKLVVCRYTRRARLTRSQFGVRMNTARGKGKESLILADIIVEHRLFETITGGP